MDSHTSVTEGIQIIPIGHCQLEVAQEAFPCPHISSLNSVQGNPVAENEWVVKGGEELVHFSSCGVISQWGALWHCCMGKLCIFWFSEGSVVAQLSILQGTTYHQATVILRSEFFAIEFLTGKDMLLLAVNSPV